MALLALCQVSCQTQWLAYKEYAKRKVDYTLAASKIERAEKHHNGNTKEEQIGF